MWRDLVAWGMIGMVVVTWVLVIVAALFDVTRKPETQAPTNSDEFDVQFMENPDFAKKIQGPR